MRMQMQMQTRRGNRCKGRGEQHWVLCYRKPAQGVRAASRRRQQQQQQPTSAPHHCDVAQLGEAQRQRGPRAAAGPGEHAGRALAVEVLQQHNALADHLYGLVDVCRLAHHAANVRDKEAR